MPLSSSLAVLENVKGVMGGEGEVNAQDSKEKALAITRLHDIEFSEVREINCLN
jgi:hypothetical protein